MSETKSALSEIIPVTFSPVSGVSVIESDCYIKNNIFHMNLLLRINVSLSARTKLGRFSHKIPNQKYEFRFVAAICSIQGGLMDGITTGFISTARELYAGDIVTNPSGFNQIQINI